MPAPEHGTPDCDPLQWLCCPITGTPLSPADARLLNELNELAQAGRLHDAAGEPITRPLQAALVNQPRTHAFPVLDGIPVLIARHAIPLDQIQQSD